MIKLETERLILREMTMEDAAYILQLDSNEIVAKAIQLTNPPASLEDGRNVVESIMKQYKENGIGRWMVFLKDSNEFLGLAGLKIEHDVNGHETFVDLGYRIFPKYWGKGYMSEAAKAVVKYGFEQMNYDKICGYIIKGTIASQRVLENAGLKYKESFPYGGAEDDDWFELTKEEYFKNNSK
jgi:ribosomal-protein-alanine N-acetyltransferase